MPLSVRQALTKPLSRRTCLILLGATLLFLVWSFVIEPERITVNRISWNAPNSWSSQCEGMKVVVVSDLHIGDRHSHPARLSRLWSMIKAEHPDLIVVPGDFMAHVMFGKTLRGSEVAETVAPLGAIAPTYAVLGNHDYGAMWDAASTGASVQEFMDFLRANGLHAMQNESIPISLPRRDGACNFWIAGLGDDFSGMADPKKALADIPLSAPVLGITHDPQVRRNVPAHRIDLLTAGHTHGGVVCVPGTIWCLSRLHEWTGGYARGWYPGSTTLWVSSGIGNSIIPARFGAPPGFDVITVHASTSSDLSP